MPEAFAIGGFLIPTRPLGVIASLLVAIWASGGIAGRLGLERNVVRGIAESSAWFGLAGARLGFVLMNWDAYRDSPWTMFYLWQPGYSAYAGITTGVAWALFRLWRQPAGTRPAHARALSGGFAGGGIFLTLLFLAFALVAGGDRLRRGDQVPDFGLRTLNGAAVRLSELSGRAVVLNFWATWCPPCRREMPLLDEMQQKYANRGVKIVGVALSEPPEAVRPFIESMGVEYSIWVDGPGEDPASDRTRELFSRFGGVGLPTTYFIGRDGVLRAIQVGELNRAILQIRIEELLSSGSG